MNDLADTNELLTFIRIVETQSFSRAASELGVPRITIGRRLKRLEARLGVRLLRRTTRKLALTDAGKEFYPNARAVIESVRTAEASVRRKTGEIRGTLRVATPPAGPAFSKLFLSFMKKYPEVRFEVHATTEFVDLIAGGFDLALRASATLAPGLIARVLQRSDIGLVASPAYLRAAGTPERAADLAQHQCLVGFERGIVPQTHWPLRAGGRVKVESALACNDIALLAEAALAGQGIAFLPESFLSDLLRRGRLVRVMPDIVGITSQVALVYVERELMPPVMRAFIEHTVAWSKKGFLQVEKECAEELTD